MPILQTLPIWVQLALLFVPGVLAAAGFFMNVWQSCRTNKQTRAALVAGCLKGFADDYELQNAFYAIEYSVFKYDDSFHNSKFEREIDKLLRHFVHIALAWQAGLLSIADIKPIQYYVLKVMRDPEIRHYLEFIADWSQQNNIGEHPYAVLTKLSEQLAKSSIEPAWIYIKIRAIKKDVKVFV